nr:putative glycerate dehydrogenase [uncultured bacterium pG7]
MKGLYILDSAFYELIYGEAEREDIAQLVEIYAPPQTKESVAQNPAILHEAEVVLSGWGAPLMDEGFLAAVPKLKAVFYGAGSIRGIVTEAFWEQGILITSAWAANAEPVAEYTIAQVFMCLKCVWQYARDFKAARRFLRHLKVPGGYGSTVGIISLGMVGRRVCELLRPFDLQLLAYDPFVSPQEAAQLGVELTSLEEIFRRADVVSLHTPWLKETEGMITGAHFATMKPGASFINTARGAIVREGEMIEVLKARPDLFAVLDVTYPEPPVPDSPLYTLPNVVLTPHIAGSMDGECRRMGRYMVEELRRYVRGEPLRWSISRERAAILA